ncbi:thermonuclease family protein [Manganibacter manganicus]|uniref:Nuclease n=1 Tax=Manganibacter manganicus TaxID=1873176 RepID=A0A1V8RU73_9HYPH|nr:thermonuclease family protein [Pseudaminobacter manganicus]OQM76756.1 nuclease [Pseudaminobacter manganicus]
MNRNWRARRRQRRPAPWRNLWRKLADYGFAIGLLLLLAFLVARLEERDRRTETGAASVVDGDTIRLGRTRVRLRGIDAPETAQLCRKDGTDYACGKQARQALAKLIAGRPVSCDGSRLDRYGRLLGDCSAGDTNLNRQLVLSGWAVAYGDFEHDEAAARADGRGIWAGSFERPQEWRRRHERPDATTEMRDHTRPSLLTRLRELFRF